MMFRVWLACICIFHCVHPERLGSQDLAPELADQRSLERLSDWDGLPLLGEVSSYSQQTSHDRGVADPSVSLTYGGNRDFNNFVCAGPDSEIGASLLSPYSFDRPLCDEGYVRGAVLARFEGSGRMVRSWIALQSILEQPADREVLRIYVDDVPEPVVAVPLAAAMDGSAGEIFAPPFGAGSALRLSWYYPVAFQSKLIIALDGLGDFDRYYHHTDVVLDEAQRPAADAALPEREVSRQFLETVSAPDRSHPLLAEPQMIALAPSESSDVELQGPATIHELRVALPDDELAGLAQVRVRAHWDGEAEAAIDAPLLSLLGGPVPPELPSLALTSTLEEDRRVSTLKLPMPFAKHASLSFDNQGQALVLFELRLLGSPEVPAEPFGQLHTQTATSLPSSLANAAPRTHVVASATGRGRLAGVCLRLAGHADATYGLLALPLNFLEGDVRATIDGRQALDGTGTEEYADDVFYFQDAPFGNAFVQAWGVESGLSAGAASLCRWHVLGTELDFASELELGLEIGGSAHPEVVDRIDSIAFLYLPAKK